MIFGIDYLAGASYQDLILKNHPKDFGAGFFLHTFGNAFPTIRALLKIKNKPPVIRVHSIWADDHVFRESFKTQIVEDLKKINKIAGNHKDVIFEFSPMCEHNLKREEGKDLFDFLDSKVKINDNVKYVNCVWKGDFFQRENLVNEFHTLRTPPKKGTYNFSFDGGDCLNMDVTKYKKKYNDCAVFFFWTISFNLKQKADEKVSVKERLARAYRPQKCHIRACSALATDKGETVVPTSMIIKPMSEDCGDFKSNKLLVMHEKKSDDVWLVDSAGKKLEKLSRFDPPTKGLYRYYSKKDGASLLEEKHKKLFLQVDGKMLKNYDKDIFFNPAFRDGTFK